MGNAFEDNEPLFSEDDLPVFEQQQRAYSDEQVAEIVDKVLEDLPPETAEAEGIKRNIEKLKSDGLWATARFYERLLEKREGPGEG
jgi:hypothetical protein